MNRFSIVWTIFKKEINSFLNNPASYITLVVFVILWQFLFFRNVFLIGEASLRTLFDILPWLFLIFISALTMGIFSTEKNEGTLELLLTHPVKEEEVIIGKFLATLSFVVFGLFFAFPIAICFSVFGPIDFGVVFTQFFSGLLLGASLSSLGFFFSILITNSTATLLATAGTGFLLLIAGGEFITASLPLLWAPVFERLSLLTHFYSLNKGVIDTRDIWYFSSFTLVFLSLTYLQLIKRKYGNRQDYYRYFQVGIALLIGIFVLSNIVGDRIPGRLDLTKGKIYSLSKTTKTVVSQLPDVVNITFYASGKLPGQLIPIVREVKDILKDYATASKGNIVVFLKDPSQNSQIAQEAISKGVREIQFNVIGREEFQVKTGFIGLSIEYAGKSEVIPFLENTNDLEYQLTSLIAKITNPTKKTISFLTGHGEKNLYSDYQVFQKELEKQFISETLTLDEKNTKIATKTAVLVIAGPTNSLDDKSLLAIKDFLNQGGGVLILSDSYSISPQILYPQPINNNLDSFLKDYGVSLEKNIVYDLKSHETVRMTSDYFGFFLPYPFWPVALTNQNHQITKRINGIVLPWPGSILLDEEKIKSINYEPQKLLTTTKFGGAQSGENLVLAPDKASFSRENLKEELLAVALNPKKENLGKIVVIGESDFLTDQFAQNSPENVAFGISTLAWLSAEKSLADIKTKQARPGKLIFTDPVQPSLIKYGNLVFAFILPTTLGITKIIKRKKLENLTYQK